MGHPPVGRRVDETDVRILRVMGFTPFQRGVRGPDQLRPSHIAGQLGLAPELVKDRIQRMERDGIIQGYEAFPNLRHLGLAQTTVHYNIDGRLKETVARRLRDVEGISGVFEFVGPGMCIDIYYRSPAELERRLRHIATLAEVPQPYRLFDYPFPPTTGELTALDWRIVHELRRDARRSAPDVAASLGVSAKTVNRRIDRMVQTASIDVLPRVDAAGFRDVIPLNLACYFAPGTAAATVSAVSADLGDQAFYTWVPPSAEMGNFDVFAYVRKPREIEELRRRVAAVPGVERVEVLMPCNVVFTTDWLTEAIAARMSGTQVAAP